MTKYLKNKSSGEHAESDVNAVVFLYYLLKSQKSVDVQATMNLHKNVFELCHTRVPEPLKSLHYFANHYENLFSDEPLLATAIIYYFLADTDITLNFLLTSSDIFARYSCNILMMYIGLRLNDKYDQFNKRFMPEDHRIKVINTI